MSLQSWQETLVSSQVDGTAITATTTATSLLGTSGAGASAAKFTLPANYFSVGKVLRISSRGRITTVTTPGTLTLDIRLGSVVVFNGGAVALNATAKTNVSWKFEAILTCRTIGAATNAALLGIGSFTSEAVVGAAAGTTVTAMLPATAPTVGTGFDSTAGQTIDHFATWSLNNADSIQMHEYVVESLN